MTLIENVLTSVHKFIILHLNTKIQESIVKIKPCREAGFKKTN